MREFRPSRTAEILAVIVAAAVSLPCGARADSGSVGLPPGGGREITGKAAGAHEVLVGTVSMAGGESGKLYFGVSVSDVAAPSTALSDRAARRAVAATSCKSANVWTYLKNHTGQEVWRYTMSDSWCWRSGAVMSAASPANIEGKVYSWAGAIGWQFNGTISQRVVDLYGNRSVYQSNAQGKFSFCPPRVLCAETHYPSLTLNMYNDGHFDAIWNTN